MRHISRNIWTSTDTTNGTLFLFRVRKRTEAIFLTLEMAEEYRLEYDMEKKEWQCYTLECVKEIPEDEEIHSKIVRDRATGKWYAKLAYKDDIIVSDLYATKNQVKDVKKYLDNERWSVRALNHLKKNKISSTRKYSGILPTKKGYLLLDANGEEHGLFTGIEEAMTERNKLRSKGVLI